jgi:hypothetical protein
MLVCYRRYLGEVLPGYRAQEKRRSVSEAVAQLEVHARRLCELRDEYSQASESWDPAQRKAFLYRVGPALLDLNLAAMVLEYYTIEEASRVGSGVLN